MIDLLIFLIHFCPELFEKPGFRFKDSKAGPHAAAGSSLLLESDDVQIYICNERGAITWEIRSLYDSSNKNWFSFDLVSHLLGHQVKSGIMNPENSALLLSNLGQIINRFRKENVAATVKKLNELKAERAKRM